MPVFTRVFAIPLVTRQFEKRPGSNPTLSAKLFKINKLPSLPNPLSGVCFVFGMSDMQFCKAQVSAVKGKTERLGISFSSTRTLTMVTQSPATAARVQTAERVLIHVDTGKSEMLVNNRFAYVSVSG